MSFNSVVIIGTILFITIIGVSCSVGRIETGSVGVRTTFNKTVVQEEVQQGIYVAVLDSVKSYVVKETELQLNDLKPKAKDNLFLSELDLSIFYTINPSQVAEQITKYSNLTSVDDSGNRFPNYFLVQRIARGVSYDTISKFESLTIHSSRSEIEGMLMKSLQTELDNVDPGVYTITKVIIRQALTDPSLEESIRLAVDMQKKVEAKQHELALAKAEAERKIAEANGVAESNRVITSSLTDKLLQWEQLKVQAQFAGQGTHTVLMPQGTNPQVLITK